MSWETYKIEKACRKDVGKILHNAPHSIIAKVTLPRVWSTKDSHREWLINLGQVGQGGHYWYLGGEVTGKGGQFGVRILGQDRRQSEVVVDLRPYANKTITISTTWDGMNYRVYINGEMAAEKAFNPQFDIKDSTLSIGECRTKGVDFKGKIEEISVFTGVMEDIKQAGPKSAYNEWTDVDVGRWLNSLSPVLAERYAKSFADNAISGKVLPDLTDGDLVELGVENSFHRRRLLKEIQDLQTPEACAGAY